MGAAAVAPLAVAERAGSKQSAAPRSFDPLDWSSVRDQFALSRDVVHLTSFFLASHPRPVAEAIERHRKALDEDPVAYVHAQRGVADGRVATAAAEYMGANPAHIAFTDSTTMGLGLIYGSLHLEPGQEIVTTTHDHYSTQIALNHRADRTGAIVRTISLYDDPAKATIDEIVSRLREAITAATRIVALTWVHSSTGVKLPLADIARMLTELNRARDESDRILLCGDGVHGLGVDDVTMEDLGCDFFIAGTHKWLFGPRGTGVIWATEEAWNVARPVIPSFGANYGVWLGFGSAASVAPGDLMSPGGFHSFEHRWALAEAFQFHLAIGKSRIASRIHELNTLAKNALAQIPGVTLRTPMSADLSAGIICFEMDGLDPEEVVNRLHEKHIVASVTPYRTRYIRIAPSILNTEEEIDRTMSELRAMAG